MRPNSWEGKATSPTSLVTTNRMGRTTTVLNEINERFVEFSATATKPVLDVGCAFGVAALAAVARGAVVIANDTDPAHLAAVEAAVPSERRLDLSTALGHFPADLDFEEGSVAAVHASNVLNFLRGEDIEIGAAKLARWLMQGGKVFVIGGTPFANNVKGFIPIYNARRRAGARWPGECDGVSAYSEDPTISELPHVIHLLDDVVLRRAFEEAGLHVEEARMFHRRNTPEYLRYDGRENVYLLATKR